MRSKLEGYLSFVSFDVHIQFPEYFINIEIFSGQHNALDLLAHAEYVLHDLPLLNNVMPHELNIYLMDNNDQLILSQ